MASFFKRAAAALGISRPDSVPTATAGREETSPPIAQAAADVDALWTEADLEVGRSGRAPREVIEQSAREPAERLRQAEAGVAPRPGAAAARHAKGRAPKAPKVKRKPPFVEWVKYDGAEIVVKAAYHPPARDIFKAVKASFIVKADSPNHRCWRMPVGNATRFARLIKGMYERGDWDFTDDPEALASMVDAALENPEPGLLTEDIQITLYTATAANEEMTEAPPAEGDEEDAPLPEDFLVVMCPYHAGVNQMIVNMGGKFSPSNKAWVIPEVSAAFFAERVAENFPVANDRIHQMEGQYFIHGSLGGTSTSATGLSLSKSAASAKSGGRGKAEEDVGHLLADIPPRMLGSVTAAKIDEIIGKYECDPYQVVGVKHLLRFNSSLLADDMGLGKTRQGIIAADIARGGGSVLVVAPASLLLNWKKEIEMVVPNAGRVSVGKITEDRVDWAIISYQQLPSIEKIAGRFAVMVLDEAHKLKNPRTGTTKAAFSVAQKIRSRMILTGTPLLNNEQEIHTLLKLSGHPLGMMGLRAFKAQYAGDPEFRVALNKELDDWMLRRDKSTVLTLKGKRRQPMAINLEQGERHKYMEIMCSERLQPFQKVTALRQLLEAAKMEFILERINSRAPGDKFIIFCEYKESVTTISAALKRRGIKLVTITGDTSKTKRQAAVDTFQTDPECLVFMGTTQAAGVGITLTAANRVIFAGLPWTMALLDQAEDRANRRGQTRLVRSELVLAEDTLDQQVMALLDHKGAITQQVVEGIVVQQATTGTLIDPAALAA